MQFSVTDSLLVEKGNWLAAVLVGVVTAGQSDAGSMKPRWIGDEAVMVQEDLEDWQTKTF